MSATTTVTHQTAGESIASVDQLEDLLSEPTDAVVETMRRIEGDILLLGVGGKMGPSLARMARRAADAAASANSGGRRIIGVARFSNPQLPRQLNAWGIETLTADALNADDLARLPDVPNIIYMVGMKFGTTGREAMTWAMNVSVPTLVSLRYPGPDHRMIAFSSGNVYGLTPVSGGGSKETDPVNPVGEYSMSALGRERVFQHYSEALGTPTALIRLNYAVEMRYGVLVDLARWVWEGKPIDVSMGHTNVIWQGDANAMTLRALEHVASPARILNVAGPEILRVRDIAERFGRMMHREPKLTGDEGPDALLNDATTSRKLLGEPRVGINRLMQWIADWVMRGGESLGKPTHFENREGKF